MQSHRKAVGKLVNLDNIEEIITVEFEARSIAEPAKFRMNEVQGLGAEITYMRRYLYFLILDIVVADDFDGESGKKTEDDDVPAPTTTKKKPVTAEKREEIKQELTSPEANADELQINALKAALRNLREIDPSKEEFIQQIALKTEGLPSRDLHTLHLLSSLTDTHITSFTPESIYALLVAASVVMIAY